MSLYLLITKENTALSLSATQLTALILAVILTLYGILSRLKLEVVTLVRCIVLNAGSDMLIRYISTRPEGSFQLIVTFANSLPYTLFINTMPVGILGASAHK